MRCNFLILTAILFSLPFVSSSQQISATGPQTEWELTPAQTNFAPSMDLYHNSDYKKIILHFDKGTVYSIKYDKDSYGMAMVDFKGNVKWESHTKDQVLGMAKIGSDILCFYSPGYSERKMTTLFAAVYDPMNGKMLKEKQIETNTEDFDLEPKVLSVNEQFIALLIRYAAIPRKLARDKLSTTLKTEKLTFTKITSDLTTEKSLVNTSVVNGRFLGCYSLSPEEFVVCSNQADQVVAERFKVSSLTFPDKISFNLNLRDDSFILSRFNNDTSTTGTLYAAFRYENSGKDRSIAVAKINFNTKQATVKEIPCNRELSNSLSNDDEAKRSKLHKDIDNMDIADLIILNDKIILISQVRFAVLSSDGKFAKFFADQIMLTKFDIQLSNPSSAVIDRTLEVFGTAMGQKIAWYVTGNRLDLIYNRLAGIGREGAALAQIDVNNLSIIRKEQIERGDLVPGALIETEAVLWKDNKVLLPYFNSNKLKNQEMVFQQINIK